MRLEVKLRKCSNARFGSWVRNRAGVCQREPWRRRKDRSLFRAHLDFHTAASGQPTSAAASQLGSRLIADELIKLAQLRDSGVLTEEEFGQQKAKLLA